MIEECRLDPLGRGAQILQRLWDDVEDVKIAVRAAEIRARSKRK